MTRRRLVLVGGGHVHLEVLRAATGHALDADVVLLSPTPWQLYSGRMPAHLRGRITADELSIALGPLCRAAGVRFVQASATRVEADARGGVVRSTNGDYAGDVISLDVGASVAGLDTPGMAEHAFSTRPAERWSALVARVDALVAKGNGRAVSCCVVGAGVGGIEIAFAIHARIGAANCVAEVALVDAAPRMLGTWDDDATERVSALFYQRGITVHLGADVARVGAESVELHGGKQLRADIAVWTTGAAPHAWLRQSPLALHDDGWLLVDSTLRAVDGRAVWGAGDCIALEGAPWLPRSGVYAVRAAPVLAHNLRVAVEGAGQPVAFEPQRCSLALVDTADGRALAHRGRFMASGRWAWWLKHWIDGRYVRKYQRLYERLV
jgi:selenide,water dikinase